jgi:hypothetical protein
MVTNARYPVWHGVDAPPQKLRAVRAGPLTAVVDGFDLRYVSAGGIEIVRRIYAAVRDRYWNTIPGHTLAYDVEDRDDSFTVRFTVCHRSRDVDFTWDGGIEGSAEGAIELWLDGAADDDMLFNRIGFCILHPYRQTRGRPYRAHTPEGDISGEFPRLIGAQRFENGIYLPLFPSFDRLDIDLEAGGTVCFEFEGDLWEDEDQRNWTDASFKTYCTPIKLGFPHELPAGGRITQRVRVSLAGVMQGAAETPASALRVGRPLGRRLPRLGLGSASDGAPLSERELDLVRALGLDHLRVDVHPTVAGWEEGLRRGRSEAERLGWGLELALFLQDAEPLPHVAQILAGARVDRVLVLVEGAQTATPDETTPASFVDSGRNGLAATLPGALFAGGTDLYFTELNRTRPDAERMDAVFYSIIPQVHAFDDLSLIETLEAQAETVESARSLAAGKPVVVSPVTLRRRFNPHATGDEAEPEPGQLPDTVDARQPSLLGAAWTLGSIKYLAEAGVASATYFETAGWRGVVEREAGAPLPEAFASSPGQAFPLYRVLACMGEWKDAKLLECSSSQPLRVVGLSVARDGGGALLAANLQADPVMTRFEGLTGRMTLRRLNDATAPDWSEPQLLEDPSLELGPYEIIRIDA